MNGIVDDAGRALLRVRIRKTTDVSPTPLDVWIDTGFTGDLVMPQSQIDALGLPVGAVISATLADGSTKELNTYTCMLEWFGAWRSIEVVANQGRFPLLGVGLLLNHSLHVDYMAKTLSVT